MAQRVLSHSNYNVIIAMPCKIKMLESTHFIMEGLNMTELRQRFIEDLQLQGKSEGVPTGVSGGPDITKTVSVHSLCHAYATHVLEAQAVSVREISIFRRSVPVCSSLVKHPIRCQTQYIRRHLITPWQCVSRSIQAIFQSLSRFHQVSDASHLRAKSK